MNGFFEAFHPRFILSKGLERDVKACSVALMFSSFLYSTCAGKQIFSCLMNGVSTYLGVAVKAPLNTISMMNVGIYIKHACSVNMSGISDRNRYIVIDAKACSLR
ncbi:hypothetical protein D3C76_1643950 [compost metagenome]